MSGKTRSIPINAMDDDHSQGISIDRLNVDKKQFNTSQQYGEATRSHRDEGHTFHLVEKGTVTLEIDFERYTVTAPSAVYMHPNQVHRILDFEDVTVCSLAISSEHVNPVYLKLLEEMVPVKPLFLTPEVQSVVADSSSLCMHFSTLRNTKIYHPLLKDSCNMLIAYLTSRFLNQTQQESHLSRFETVSRSFRNLLEKDFRSVKRPGEYAEKLHISTAYLNECVRNTTGSSASKYIQDRVILEAKRMLYHSDKSVKEIAFDLGYADYNYFARLFSKAVGTSALAFRNKNRD